MTHEQAVGMMISAHHEKQPARAEVACPDCGETGALIHTIATGEKRCAQCARQFWLTSTR
jgi:uncharacterized protein (DUF983 family)